ncbi:MAG: hypothetical protein VW268_01230 [Rhodospirillaceae bacterium]
MSKTVAFLLSANPYLEFPSLIARATQATYALLPPPEATGADAA